MVAVVPAGERWPDGSLRPAAEDLWGAGAVLAALEEPGFSPESRLARAAFRAVAGDAFASSGPSLLDELNACAGGQELIGKGFAADVAVAAGHGLSEVVPVLVDGAFVDG